MTEKGTVNYDEQQQLSGMGVRFEEYVDEILGILEVPYGKYSTGGNGCRPDYIMENNVWADAKISAYTNTVEMRRKYIPNCSKLIVIYLIGGKKAEKTLEDGTRLVSIYSIMEGLKEQTKEEYLSIFNEMGEDYYNLLNGEPSQGVYIKRLPFDILKERYIQGESLNSLGREYEVSPITVRRRLKMMGVAIRPSTEYPLPFKLKVVEAYEEAEGPIRETADKYGVSLTTVSNWIRLYGKGRRKKMGAVSKRYPNFFKERVVKAYYESSLTYQEVADKYEVTPQSIQNWVKERDLGDRLWEREKEKVRYNAVKEYTNGGETYQSLADKYRVSKGTIGYWVRASRKK